MMMIDDNIDDGDQDGDDDVEGDNVSEGEGSGEGADEGGGAVQKGGKGDFWIEMKEAELLNMFKIIIIFQKITTCS